MSDIVNISISAAIMVGTNLIAVIIAHVMKNMIGERRSLSETAQSLIGAVLFLVVSGAVILPMAFLKVQGMEIFIDPDKALTLYVFSLVIGILISAKEISKGLTKYILGYVIMQLILAVTYVVLAEAFNFNFYAVVVSSVIAGILIAFSARKIRTATFNELKKSVALSTLIAGFGIVAINLVVGRPDVTTETASLSVALAPLLFVAFVAKKGNKPNVSKSLIKECKVNPNANACRNVCEIRPDLKFCKK